MRDKRSAYEVHARHVGTKEEEGQSMPKKFGPWIKLSTEFRDRYLADLKGRL